MESLNKTQRYEYKYILNAGTISAVIPYLHKYMKPDYHSMNGPYPIYSIYLDNVNFDIYYHKLAGVLHRKKFRVRSYTSSPCPITPISLEIKEKFSDVMFKRKTIIKYSDLAELFNKESGDGNILEWKFNYYRYGLRPIIRVDYERMAFCSKSSEESRVTLDSRIHFTKPVFIGDFNSITTSLEATKTQSVLEIKFRNVLPLYLQNFIREYNLTNVAFSKYCECVTQCYHF